MNHGSIRAEYAFFQESRVCIASVNVIDNRDTVKIYKFFLIRVYIYDLLNYSHAIFHELLINASPLPRTIDRCHAFNQKELRC